MKFIPISQLDQKNPGTWPIYYKLAIWIAIVVVSIFAYDYFIYEDLISTQESNRNEITKLEKDLKVKYQYHLDLPLYQAAQKKVTENLLHLLSYLPSQTDMDSIIDQIYNASYKNGLNFSSIVPTEQKIESYYKVQPISLQTKVSFDSFTKFVQDINAIPRIIRLSQLNMNVGDSKDNQDILNVNTNLETYIYNQDLSAFGITRSEK